MLRLDGTWKKKIWLSDLTISDMLTQTSRKNSCLQEYLQEREVADVLEDFHDICGTDGVTYTDIVSNMRALQPRYYSISSSPLVVSSCSFVFTCNEYTQSLSQGVRNRLQHLLLDFVENINIFTIKVYKNTFNQNPGL